MTTRLGKSLAAGAAVASSAPAASAVSATRLSKVVLSGRRGETVELPELGTVRLELLGAREAEEIELEIERSMKADGIDLAPSNAGRLELRRARHVLARAAIDPSDRNPIGTLDEWSQLDVILIEACWDIYDDVQARLDPLAQPLTESERLLIEAAVKKKDGRLLRTFGLAKLCGWLCTTDAPPSTSPPPSSSSLESPSEG